ncbi:GntR family transcriptional regulator [Paraburkholderia ferrariae]|uniref:GntR family transcriptional regulator n=1 Tax=Paraburkholderia ferrariae TaxID=386056 RepID=UPI000487DF0A|nr:GntR family transcriptional regulator [Paraburkholderia ferrariae]
MGARKAVPVQDDSLDEDQLLTDIAFSRIEQMIVTRELPPGHMVSEIQLAEELQMGRTPVREALQRLRQLGFVEMRPRRGTSICNVDVRQQLELLEVRRPLEELIVRCACARATSDERLLLKRLAKRIVDAAKRKNIAEYFEVNRAIHKAEVTAAHNSMLTHTMLAIHAQSRRFWYQTIEEADAFLDAAKLHAAVLDGIAAGTPAEAVAACGELMSLLDRLTRAALDSFSLHAH